MSTETTATEVEFDPNALIDSAPAAAADFTDLVDSSTADDAMQARVAQELKSGAFGTIDVKDFSAFSAHDTIVSEGVYAFAVEQKFLKEATQVTKFTTMLSKGGFGAVKITLFPTKLRLATFNQSAFSEVFIPLHSTIANIDEGKEIAFIFDQGVLTKIAQSFVDAVIQFSYDAAKSLLTITSGKTQLQLSTYAKLEFVDYHNKIGSPRYLRQLPPELLRKAINYTSLFVRKDDLQLNMSLLDIRDASVIGGNYASIGVFQSEQFNGLDLRIKYDIIKAFEAIMPRFNTENTHLFETDLFYIVRDENLYFGFEKTQSKFPPIAKFFEMKAPDHVLVPRVQLLNSLYKLSVVSVDRDLLVRTIISGSGSEATLTLMTKDATGKVSSDVISVLRNSNDLGGSDFEEIDIFVSITSFIRVVSHFESANAQLEVLGRKALVIKDEHEGEWHATTLLSALTEEVVAQQKAKREEARAEAA